MATPVANVNIYLDTTRSWIEKTNRLFRIVSTEAVTANTTGGVTGSPSTPLFATLYGSFSTNTLNSSNTLTVGSTFSVSSGIVTINTGSRLSANGSFGEPGQVLVSSGTGVYWGASSGGGGGGGVTLINSANGLIGGPITSSGSLAVRPGQGIFVNAAGVHVNTSFIVQLVGSIAGDGEITGGSWSSPPIIGSVTPNAGNFTTLSANSYSIPDRFTLNTNLLFHRGYGDFTSPGINTTGGVRVRAQQDDTQAYIQVVNHAGSTEWSHVRLTPSLWSFSSDVNILNGIQVGFRNVPQTAVNTNTTLGTTAQGGRHIYKTTSSAITITVPDNGADPCPIGTAITVVNDANSGNITLAQGGSTQLQLGGTLSSSNRTIAPGGIATLMKVTLNKWIVSGPGVT